MSVFGRATFSAAGYAAFRPSYPPSLFRTVLGYRNAPSRSGTLLDLGCGHGLIARELSPSFDKAIATDPSAGMIKQAARMTENANVTFHQCGAEELGFLPNGSLDMVVSGQAAHWFDYAKAWPELAKKVKSGGSLAFWGYRDIILIGHKRANDIMYKFCYGEGEVEPGLEGMNKYWERPGRDIVRNLLREVEPPKSDWDDVRRILCDVDSSTTEVPGPEEAWLQQRITLGGLEGYLHTYSVIF
jgi:SAM-dependent methyltransferase